MCASQIEGPANKADLQHMAITDQRRARNKKWFHMVIENGAMTNESEAMRLKLSLLDASKCAGQVKAESDKGTSKGKCKDHDDKTPKGGLTPKFTERARPLRLARARA